MERKRKSWKEFVSQITPNMPITEVWNKIRQIKGAQSFSQCSIIIQNHKNITSPQQITNIFANHFEQNSSNNKFSNEFKQFKNISEREEIGIVNTDHVINNPFSMHELKSAISEIKVGRCPGLDGLPLEIIKKPPISFIYHFIKYLFKYYNII